MDIIPAILEMQFDSIAEKVKLMRGHADWVQIDVGDAAFAKETFRDGDALESLDTDNPKFEIHLMVDKPWEAWQQWERGGGDRFYFHHRSFTSVERNTREFAINNLINSIKESQTRNGDVPEVGMALEIEESITALEPYLSKLDAVLLMSIPRIGAQGVEFDERVLGKIKALKALWPQGTVAADGGINESNIMRLKEAGLDSAVVGSGIFGVKDKDPLTQLKTLQNMVAQDMIQ